MVAGPVTRQPQVGPKFCGDVLCPTDKCRQRIKYALNKSVVGGVQLDEARDHLPSIKPQ
jgi:hypothetical protein